MKRISILALTLLVCLFEISCTKVVKEGSSIVYKSRKYDIRFESAQRNALKVVGVVVNSDNVEVNIPDKIKFEDKEYSVTEVSIGNWSSHIDNMISLQLPSSVVSLSLDECPNLSVLNIPSSLASLSIKNCDKISKIAIPQKAISLVLKNCKNVQIDAIPIAMTYLSIDNCSSIDKIVLPRSLTSIKISDVSTLEKYVFSDGMPNVTIENCPLLKEICLSVGISKLSIINCPLVDSLQFGDGTTSINIEGCPAVGHLEFPSQTTNLKISGCPSVDSLVLPESMRNIDIEKCSRLSHIIADFPINEISINVCPIETLRLGQIENSASINNCPQLSSIFFKTSAKSITITNCEELTTVTLPASLDVLKISSCNKLKNIRVPNNVTDLSVGQCPQLSSLAVPKSVTRLNVSYCDKITKLRVPGDIDWSNFDISGSHYIGSYEDTKYYYVETENSTVIKIFEVDKRGYSSTKIDMNLFQLPGTFLQANASGFYLLCFNNCHGVAMQESILYYNSKSKSASFVGTCHYTEVNSSKNIVTLNYLKGPIKKFKITDKGYKIESMHIAMLSRDNRSWITEVIPPDSDGNVYVEDILDAMECCDFESPHLIRWQQESLLMDPLFSRQLISLGLVPKSI
ncbi:MAG: leucine-rich repeat protein [Bacteroidales bacterium]|nr:leucine-rich repeat protein [Bacteroidales bacterium]